MLAFKGGAVATAFLISTLQLLAQNRDTPRGLPPGEMVVGRVTAVGKDSITVAPLAGGDSVALKIGDSTRLMKQRQPIKADEIKVDDTIFARGELKGKVMQAALVSIVNPEMVQRLEQGRLTGGGAGGGFSREDLGKKFIVGEVKAIEETRLTIARPDGQTQAIEVDENTSFRRGNESITLPEIKVGDFVRGQGELKAGVFVPKELIVGRPQMRFFSRGEGQRRPDAEQADANKGPDKDPPRKENPPKL
jgi:hypothetical protein